MNVWERGRCLHERKGKERKGKERKLEGGVRRKKVAVARYKKLCAKATKTSVEAGVHNITLKM
jgi:hypothetical protein